MKKEIMKVGQVLADNWGAKCIDYKMEGENVIFFCKEFNEVFTTTISRVELEQRLNGTYKKPSLEELRAMALGLNNV